MTWLDLKQTFIHQLLPLYSKGEAEHFFRILLENFWNIGRLDFFRDREKQAQSYQQEMVENAIKDLLNHKPIQHITGKAYCFERAFKVNENVLIPRPETEELISIILKENDQQSLDILDIGTGSGIIPITLLLEQPTYKVSALDVSESALNVARKNAQNWGVEVDFIQMDILNPDAYSHFSPRSLDLIVSNPPYVLESEKAQMQKNVLDFDPHLALFVEDDQALVFYKAISQFAQQTLKPKGKLYFEINEQFGKEMQLMLSDYFQNVKVLKDFRDRDRFVVAECLK